MVNVRPIPASQVASPGAIAYWSSSHYDAVTAWPQSFPDGPQGSGSKNYTIGVRPVRAF